MSDLADLDLVALADAIAQGMSRRRQQQHRRSRGRPIMPTSTHLLQSTPIMLWRPRRNWTAPDRPVPHWDCSMASRWRTRTCSIGRGASVDVARKYVLISLRPKPALCSIDWTRQAPSKLADCTWRNSPWDRPGITRIWGGAAIHGGGRHHRRFFLRLRGRSRRPHRHRRARVRHGWLRPLAGRDMWCRRSQAHS